MGRGKHCSEEKRKIIKKMLEEGKTFAEISRLLGCSNKMISNAKKFVPKVVSRTKTCNVAITRQVVISTEQKRVSNRA